MNFEGFKILIQRVAAEWWNLAKKEIIEIDSVKAYLQDSPFLAKQTPENEAAYERLMDIRCKLYVSKSSKTDNSTEIYKSLSHQNMKHIFSKYHKGC